MNLSFAEIKDLIAYGQELGLQQLQTEGLVVVYGARAVLPASPAALSEVTADADEVTSITQMYAAMGKDRLKR